MSSVDTEGLFYKRCMLIVIFSLTGPLKNRTKQYPTKNEREMSLYEPLIKIIDKEQH